MEKQKYINLWKKYLPIIRIQLKKSTEIDKLLQLNQTEFEATGDRDSSNYTFNLEIERGKVINDISGTAVARDLYTVLSKDALMKEFLKDKKVKISMGRTFEMKFKAALV